MIRVGCIVEIFAVATYAIVPNSIETQRRFAQVAGIATHRCVYAGEGETILLVEFSDVVYQPVIRRMAARAVVPDGLLVNVRVAGNTIGSSF